MMKHFFPPLRHRLSLFIFCIHIEKESPKHFGIGNQLLLHLENLSFFVFRPADLFKYMYWQNVALSWNKFWEALWCSKLILCSCSYPIIKLLKFVSVWYFVLYVWLEVMRKEGWWNMAWLYIQRQIFTFCFFYYKCR